VTRQFATVSEVARERGLAPRIISDLFYARKLDDSRCPIMGGRRMIPFDYLPELDLVLHEAGLLKPEEVRASGVGSSNGGGA
jgi:hypothetical protein